MVARVKGSCDVHDANVMRMSVTAKSLLPHSFTDSYQTIFSPNAHIEYLVHKYFEILLFHGGLLIEYESFPVDMQQSLHVLSLLPHTVQAILCMLAVVAE